jgi:hypothetical protein
MLTVCICLLFATAITAYASDETMADIRISCSAPCIVELKGISENTEGYAETNTCDKDSTAFSVTLTEPGQYEYELKQVASGRFEIYDKTVYQVFVNVVYENDQMVSIVTGGIKGTEDKPEEFKFTLLPSESGTESTPEPPAEKPQDNTHVKKRADQKPVVTGTTTGKGTDGITILDNIIPLALPVTGDFTKIWPYLLLICVSIAGLMSITYIKIKGKEKKDTDT